MLICLVVCVPFCCVRGLINLCARAQVHKLRNKLSGQHPSSIHFNGGAKERQERDGYDFAQIEPQLWYMQPEARARCGVAARQQRALERAFVFHAMDLQPVRVQYADLCGVRSSP